MEPRTGEDVFRYRLSLQYEDGEGVFDKIASPGFCDMEQDFNPDAQKGSSQREKDIVTIKLSTHPPSINNPQGFTAKKLRDLIVRRAVRRE